MRVLPTLAAALVATPALAEPPRVMTDIAVTQGLVAMVMGDLGTPDVLLGQGADPHSFQLRPSQARTLGEADLVVWVGADLTPWLERSLSQVASDATSLSLLEAEGVVLRAYSDDHGDHDDHDHAHDDDPAHDDDHDHDHDHDHAHDDDDHDHAHGDDHDETHAHDDHDHDHAHGDIDPHAWLDPANARTWVGTIAEALSAADPGNAATYAARAEAAQSEIDRVAAEVAEILAPVNGRSIVVFHDAFGYFEASFDVDIAGSIALGDAAAPGAGRLRALLDEIGEANVSCVFAEPQHDASLAQSVAEDAGIGLGLLDPTGSLAEPGPDHYANMMTGIARAIADCAAS